MSHSHLVFLTFLMSQRQSTICELVFPTTVLGVKLNRRRLVVILEEEIYIYDISNMKLLHTIETSPNPQGKCGCTVYLLNHILEVE